MEARWIYSLVTYCIFALPNASIGAVLSIPERIPGQFNIPIALPVIFTTGEEDVSAIIFSVDFDEGCLHFDPADIDPADGIPDDVLFVLPPQLTGSVSYDAEDTDGELDFVIADFGPPLASIPDGPVVHIILTPSCHPSPPGTVVRVGFSANPAVSFGGTAGQNVPGTSIEGSIQVDDPIFSDGFESGDMSAWSVTVGN